MLEQLSVAHLFLWRSVKTVQVGVPQGALNAVVALMDKTMP
jgi:hypothetical protein